MSYKNQTRISSLAQEKRVPLYKCKIHFLKIWLPQFSIFFICLVISMTINNTYSGQGFKQKATLPCRDKSLDTAEYLVLIPKWPSKSINVLYLYLQSGLRINKYFTFLLYNLHSRWRATNVTFSLDLALP